MPHRTPAGGLSYRDFLRFPEDGNRHELVAGGHLMTPSPRTRHQEVSGNLFYLIRDHIRRTKAGRVFAAPMDVVLSDRDVVAPDLIFIAAARDSIITEKNVRGAPDLLIEIVSKSTRKTDETIKRRLYERCGVGEYWIVDPELEAVEVFRLAEGKYFQATKRFLKDSGAIETPLWPGLGLRLSEIFA